MKKSGPVSCPHCGEYKEWKIIGTQETRGGFSGGKAVAGAFLFGTVGLLAGASGKKNKICYKAMR